MTENQSTIKKYLKTKSKSGEDKTVRNIYDNEMFKESFNCIRLSETLIDFVFKISKTGVFRRIQIHIQRKILSKYISDELEISSGDADEEASDKEASDLKKIMHKPNFKDLVNIAKKLTQDYKM